MTIFANVDNFFAKELQTTIFASDIEFQYPSIVAININQYQPISININQYQSISININQYQPISININQYQPISINIHQSLPAARRAPPLCPCAPNTVVDIETCDFIRFLNGSLCVKYAFYQWTNTSYQ